MWCWGGGGGFGRGTGEGWVRACVGGTGSARGAQARGTQPRARDSRSSCSSCCTGCPGRSSPVKSTMLWSVGDACGGAGAGTQPPPGRDSGVGMGGGGDGGRGLVGAGSASGACARGGGTQPRTRLTQQLQQVGRRRFVPCQLDLIVPSQVDHSLCEWAVKRGGTREGGEGGGGGGQAGSTVGSALLCHAQLP